jgi:uncharacterized cupredoxin-like copper-binding protein
MLLALVVALSSAPSTARDTAVAVVATDYAFEMPDSLIAGETSFRLINRGRELHHLYLARLSAGRTAKEFVAALKKGGPPPNWAMDVGGPNGADPGTSSFVVTVPLTPGHYAALCIIPGRDGVPHAMKGMYKDVVVSAGMHAAALRRRSNSEAAAAPSTTIGLADYAFDIEGPLTSGVHRVRVHNTAKQSHELELARLLPGKTPADLAAWAEKMAGPPPAHFLGGVSPLGPGRTNELTLDLTPGHYVMLCFVPDNKDGKPHVAHGMVHDFVIK